jgi:hypothetical protein
MAATMIRRLFIVATTPQPVPKQMPPCASKHAPAFHPSVFPKFSPLALLLLLLQQEPLKVSVDEAAEEAVAITTCPPHVAIHVLQAADLVHKHLAAVGILCMSQTQEPGGT